VSEHLFFNSREQAVLEFHEKFKAAIQAEPTVELLELRAKLIAEEAQETVDAIAAAVDLLKQIGNVPKEMWLEILDGMADLQVVLSGTAVALRPLRNFPEAFFRVHESNMSKLDENGNAIIREDGKILKSSLYKPPVLHDLV
jgi:predicted HAD superfamily Cof-like phosphohydrolase